MSSIAENTPKFTIKAKCDNSLCISHSILKTEYQGEHLDPNYSPYSFIQNYISSNYISSNYIEIDSD